MMGWTLDRSFAAATVAIALATVAGLLTAGAQAGGPFAPGGALEAWSWAIAPVVAGVTALAALVRQRGHVDDDPDDGEG